MPFRCLEYLVAHYNRFFDKNDKYNTKEIKLPRPECYVFYNGDDPFPQEKTMRLSDAFIKLKDSKLDLPDSLTLDLTVKVYNINRSAKHPILKKCEALLAFSDFTEYVRIGRNKGVENPLHYALEQCRNGSVLAGYFNNLSKEEQSMIFDEWDEEMFVKVQKQIAVEDNKIENARNLLKMNLGTPEQISQAVSLPLEQVLALKEELATVKTEN